MGQGKKNQPKCGNNKLWLTTTATFRSKEESFPCKSRGGLKDIDLGIDFFPTFTYKSIRGLENVGRMGPFGLSYHTMLAY